MGRNVTQTEWLTNMWERLLGTEEDSYLLLKSATHARGRAESMSRSRLGYLRRQFVNDHVMRKKYPLAGCCFLCGETGEKNFLVRHHIVALKNYGSNRRINLVTLCSRCHAYLHPWLLKRV